MTILWLSGSQATNAQDDPTGIRYNGEGDQYTAGQHAYAISLGGVFYHELLACFNAYSATLGDSRPTGWNKRNADKVRGASLCYHLYCTLTAQ
jgi:hypothetical protein